MFINQHHQITTDFTIIKNHYNNNNNNHNSIVNDQNSLWSNIFNNSNKNNQYHKKQIKIEKNNNLNNLKKFSNNNKMPPITEKRSPSIIKSNVKENFPSSNTNTTTTTTTTSPATIVNGSNGITNNKQLQQQQQQQHHHQQSQSQQQQQLQQHPLSDKIENRVPEISDFRDSWLQEIEKYKDQIKAQQQHILIIQQQQQQQQQNHHHHHYHNHHHHHHRNNYIQMPPIQGEYLNGNETSTTPIMNGVGGVDGVNSALIKDDNEEGITTKKYDAMKRRVRTRSDSDSYKNDDGHLHRRYSEESDERLILKRARRDISITSSLITSSTLSSFSSPNNKNKIPHHDNNNRHSKLMNRNHRKRKSPSPSPIESLAATTTTAAPASTTIPSRTATTTTATVTTTSSSVRLTDATAVVEQNQHDQFQEKITSPSKIITNPYHASLLNNSQRQQQQQQKHHQDQQQLDKHKLLNKNCPSSSPTQSLSNGFNHNENSNSLKTLQKSSNIVVKSSPSSSQQSQLSSIVVESTKTTNKNNENMMTTTKSTTTTTTDHSSTVRKSSSSSSSSSNNPSAIYANKKVHPEPIYMTSEFNDYEEDDVIGEIDDADILESSDNDDDEYVGYAYYLNSNEPLNKNDITKINDSNYNTPIKPFSPSLFPNVPPYINFSSHADKGPPIPNDIQKILKWKLTSVMPRIVRKVVSNSGFRLLKKTNDWIGTWEKHMKSPCFKTIRSHQKFNHLPGSFKIGRKDSVWRNLNIFSAKHGKKEFGIMPKTYILPHDYNELKKAWPKYARKNTKWIIKPPASARGTGIKVINRWSQIPRSTPLIVQKYIERPLLIEGNKFDLRLYIVITSINPLRIYLHTNGLARFASVQYSDKLDTLNDRCMHLTNYSINKFSSNYAKNEDINACQGHKWTLKSLWSYFQKRGINTKRLWATLRNLIIRTVLSGEKCLNNVFKQNISSKYSCYELFGFDILLDENLIPWLLEVNISPSLHSDLQLDQHVKGPLLQAVLNTAMFQVPPKIPEQLEKQILKEYNLKGPLCYDKRIYTMCLSAEESRKHNHFTGSSIEDREDYLDTILDDLTPDDVRCLIIAEDELSRSSPLERIFPGPESHLYLKFTEGLPRYYNRLLDAWETKYSDNRLDGINLLRKLCEKNYHLQVPSSVLARDSEERIRELQKQPEQQQQSDQQNDDQSHGNDLQSQKNSTKINDNVNDDDKINNKIMSTTSSSSIPPPLSSQSSTELINTTQPQQQQQSSQVVSCSKEAATVAASKTTDTENQLSNGPRAIAVEIQ